MSFLSGLGGQKQGTSELSQPASEAHSRIRAELRSSLAMGMGGLAVRVNERLINTSYASQAVVGRPRRLLYAFRTAVFSSRGVGQTRQRFV